MRRTISGILICTSVWEDPEIGVCVRDDNLHSDDGIYKFGRNLEDEIWHPDLHVWNFKSIKRGNGLAKLNDMEVELRDNCPAQITLGYYKLQINLTEKWIGGTAVSLYSWQLD